jgi:uncharacterized damage-inducible protein DinB
MIRSTLLVLASACLMQAQATNPLIAESQRTYTGVKNNLTKAAEKMPEDLYAFQPVPEIRTFAALLAHIADSQLGLCSSVRGERKPPTAANKTAKADLVAALAASYAECDGAWDSITDANATELVGQGKNARTKLGTLIYMTAHSNEEYGYMSVYMRLKNIVPPSSDNAGRGAPPKKGE